MQINWVENRQGGPTRSNQKFPSCRAECFKDAERKRSSNNNIPHRPTSFSEESNERDVTSGYNTKTRVAESHANIGAHGFASGCKFPDATVRSLGGLERKCTGCYKCGGNIKRHSGDDCLVYSNYLSASVSATCAPVTSSASVSLMKAKSFARQTSAPVSSSSASVVFSMASVSETLSKSFPSLALSKIPAKVVLSQASTSTSLSESSVLFNSHPMPQCAFHLSSQSTPRPIQRPKSRLLTQSVAHASPQYLPHQYLSIQNLPLAQSISQDSKLLTSRAFQSRPKPKTDLRLNICDSFSHTALTNWNQVATHASSKLPLNRNCPQSNLSSFVVNKGSYSSYFTSYCSQPTLNANMVTSIDSS